MADTLIRRQDAQAAIEALERRRLQNRIAQKNRRKRQAELQRKREQEVEVEKQKEGTEQRHVEGHIPNQAPAHCSSEQTISPMTALGPRESQSETMQYVPWREGSSIVTVSNGTVDDIYNNIMTPVSDHVLDLQLQSLQYCSSSPELSMRKSPQAREITNSLATTRKLSSPTSTQPSRTEERAEQYASHGQPSAHITARNSPLEVPIPTGPTSPPTPSTQISDSRWIENRGKTALHISAERGNIKILRTLLHYGVDINGTDSKGRSALYYASLNAHADVVALLLALGADPEAQDFEGRTPLRAAADAECEAVIRLLAEEGADLNAAIGMSSSSEDIEDINVLLTI